MKIRLRNPLYILLGIGIVATIVAILLIAPTQSENNTPDVEVIPSPTPGIGSVTITLSELVLSELEDCDGDMCDAEAEVYGSVTVEDQTVNFGIDDEQILTLANNESYEFRPMLAIYQLENAITIEPPESGSVLVDIVLFDRDVDDDDVLCTWTQHLSVPQPETWDLAENTRLITRNGIAGESQCEITVLVTANRQQ